MPLTSDLTLNVAPFAESAVSAQTREFNELLTKLTEQGPAWYDVGAPEYRRMREEGRTALPARVVLDDAAENVEVPSARDPVRSIPCRVFAAPSGAPPKGVLLHIHGGGWVLQSQLDFDPFCARMARDCNLTVVSVGYRLAPEHPFPAAAHDCYDVAEHLAAHAPREYGAPLAVISGESAGGHLSMLSCLHLLNLQPQPYLGLKALVLDYGIYDLGDVPSSTLFKRNLILPRAAIGKFKKAFLPDAEANPALYKDPAVSPLYADLKPLAGTLPPALFLVGTEDALFDDSLFMCARWLAAGAEGVLKILPGQPHAFSTFDPETNEGARKGNELTDEFLKDKLT